MTTKTDTLLELARSNGVRARVVPGNPAASVGRHIELGQTFGIWQGWGGRSGGVDKAEVWVNPYVVRDVVSAWTLAHELGHVFQIREWGVTGFLQRSVWQRECDAWTRATRMWRHHGWRVTAVQRAYTAFCMDVYAQNLGVNMSYILP